LFLPRKLKEKILFLLQGWGLLRFELPRRRVIGHAIDLLRGRENRITLKRVMVHSLIGFRVRITVLIGPKKAGVFTVLVSNVVPGHGGCLLLSGNLLCLRPLAQNYPFDKAQGIPYFERGFQGRRFSKARPGEKPVKQQCC
jgi:hypothetical protein